MLNLIKRVLAVILPAVLLAVAGCTALEQPAASATDRVAGNPTLSLTPTARPQPVPRQAEGIGLAFYRAWEDGNYSAMYSLLAPQSRALVDEATFTDRYRAALQTARVLTVTTQPLAATYSETEPRATLDVRVIWQSAVVGTLVRNHAMPLVYANDRWAVVWDEGLVMPELAGGNRLQMTVQTPPRAAIFDRQGAQLAYQGTGVTLGVVPAQLTDPNAFAAAVGSALGRTPQQVLAAFADVPEGWYAPLGTLTEEQANAAFATLEPFINNGLELRAGSGRLYTASGVAPHLIGYTGYIPPESRDYYLARGYGADERIGLTGLESWGQPYLAGRRGGELRLLRPDGQSTVLAEAPAQVGRMVYTSFDSAFQLAVQQALAEALTTHPAGRAGAIVVLDVNSGAIRAMASYPAYDPAIFSELQAAGDSTITALLNDPRQPLLNRATQGAYPPGSTFKIITMAAGLTSGQFAPETRYFCTGLWDELGPNAIKTDWLAGGHGSITLVQALTRSCNPYMYHIGFVLDGVDPYLLPNMARAFGLGQPTGLQGASETGGIIPDPAWKLANIGDGWATGDAVNMAIGQGFVLATPLQIASVSAAVANGGTLYQPTLIDRIAPGMGVPEETRIPPQVRATLTLSADQLRVIQQAMDDVTSGAYGTAADKMAGLGVTTAGKTGTAESGSGLPHAWFTGYAPAQQPEIAIAVVVENAGEGSQVAAPIFRRIIELYYGFEPTRYPWQ